MIHVARRFHRSVSLTLDWGRPEALRGYLVSPLVRTCGERILEELAHIGGTRAWSVVGPYGTGKSAFVLYLSTLLSEVGLQRHHLLRRLTNDPKVIRGFDQRSEGWMPVLVVGERAPLLVAVVKALHKAVLDARPSGRGRPPHVEKALVRTLAKMESGLPASGSEVLAMVDDVVAYAALHYAGVFIVFDELGKFLEHAAHEPTTNDVYFLQQLAERAARTESLPLAVLTVLHQSFALYAEHLPDRERQEWEKVQGRYNEIPFLEPVDHLVRLAGSAIESTEPSQSPMIQRHGEALEQLRRLLPPSRSEVLSALKGTAPLHPVVAALLAPVFRGPLAQNERSLFTFLVSTEPGGFGAFLAESGGNPTALYDIDRLFEYVSCVLAARVSRRRHERVFGLAERALSRIGSTESADSTAIIKTVALLERFGEEAGLLPNIPTIALALSLPESVVEGHLKALDRYVVHRQFSDSYHLWDGSDVDLEREITAARQVVEHSGNIAGVLERHVALRPVVAGRHLHRTGTLRYLEPRLVEETAFDGELRPEHPANGLMVYVLPRSTKAGRELTEKLSDQAFRARVLPHPAYVVAVADDATRIREQALSLLALDHALSASKALRVDPVARRELEVQLNDASNRLLGTLGIAFGWGAASGEARARWFSSLDGECTTPQRISHLASEVMDAAYHKAPCIHNELLNRSALSSQAAKARRELVEAMIERADLEHLGFDGNPPALAMYLSVVRASGLHDHGRHPVWATPTGAYGEVWANILRVLERWDAPMRVDELFDYLGRPPFGLREGVLPVLLVGILLTHPERITLFEDGSLVPVLETEVAERLLRRPKTFEVRAFASSHGRERVLRAVLDRLPTRGLEEPTVLNATSALILAVGRLSDYAKATSRISRETKAVRTTLLSARDPHDLLFHRLPADLGLVSSAESDGVAYVNALMAALDELGGVERKLMERLHEKILGAFVARDQAEIARRCRDLPESGVIDLVAGLKLRAQEETSRDEWVYGIATFLVHRPPDKWRDQDEAAFDLKLREAARLSRRYELVGREQWSEGVPRLLVSVLRSDGTETSDFAVVREDEEAGVEALSDAIVKSAAQQGLNRDQILRAVVRILNAHEVDERRPRA